LPAGRRFRARFGAEPPLFLVISPGHQCNLRCPGCYSASAGNDEKLPWPVFDRIMREAQQLWGVPLVAISGGEPLAYRSEGKDILDMTRAHPDCLFVIFTNGTLLTAADSERLNRLRANTALVCAVDGLRERTDASRGQGTFDHVLRSIKLVQASGAPSAFSVTVTRQNWRELVSDDFIDLFFNEVGVFCGFFFLYMPMGRSSDPELMLTPEERMEFWDRSWRLIADRRILLFDFWHFGTQVGGCVSAGRERGHLHIDWEGRVSPCVFAPYAGANIHDIYRNGGNLDDVWERPFFTALRRWQTDYGEGEAGTRGNLLRCCPVRDHNPMFLELVRAHEAEPLYETARDSLSDAAYGEAMELQGEGVRELSQPVWEREYLRRY
jgi:MoaA/NifB/PqqE/SkfB family radical SAM enzyme